jgi:chemotaxis protein histidine kinase CheA
MPSGSQQQVQAIASLLKLENFDVAAGGGGLGGAASGRINELLQREAGGATAEMKAQMAEEQAAGAARMSALGGAGGALGGSLFAGLGGAGGDAGEDLAARLAKEKELLAQRIAEREAAQKVAAEERAHQVAEAKARREEQAKEAEKRKKEEEEQRRKEAEEKVRMDAVRAKEGKERAEKEARRREQLLAAERAQLEKDRKIAEAKRLQEEEEERRRKAEEARQRALVAKAAAGRAAVVAVRACLVAWQSACTAVMAHEDAAEAALVKQWKEQVAKAEQRHAVTSLHFWCWRQRARALRRQRELIEEMRQNLLGTNPATGLAAVRGRVGRQAAVGGAGKAAAAATLVRPVGVGGEHASPQPVREEGAVGVGLLAPSAKQSAAARLLVGARLLQTAMMQREWFNRPLPVGAVVARPLIKGRLDKQHAEQQAERSAVGGAAAGGGAAAAAEGLYPGSIRGQYGGPGVKEVAWKLLVMADDDYDSAGGVMFDGGASSAGGAGDGSVTQRWLQAKLCRTGGAGMAKDANATDATWLLALYRSQVELEHDPYSAYSGASGAGSGGGWGEDEDESMGDGLSGEVDLTVCCRWWCQHGSDGELASPQSAPQRFDKHDEYMLTATQSVLLLCEPTFSSALVTPGYGSAKANYTFDWGRLRSRLDNLVALLPSPRPADAVAAAVAPYAEEGDADTPSEKAAAAVAKSLRVSLSILLVVPDAGGGASKTVDQWRQEASIELGLQELLTNQSVADGVLGAVNVHVAVLPCCRPASATAEAAGAAPANAFTMASASGSGGTSGDGTSDLTLAINSATNLTFGEVAGDGQALGSLSTALAWMARMAPAPVRIEGGQRLAVVAEAYLLPRLHRCFLAARAKGARRQRRAVVMDVVGGMIKREAEVVAERQSRQKRRREQLAAVAWLRDGREDGSEWGGGGQEWEGGGAGEGAGGGEAVDEGGGDSEQGWLDGATNASMAADNHAYWEGAWEEGEEEGEGRAEEGAEWDGQWAAGSDGVGGEWEGEHGQWNEWHDQSLGVHEGPIVAGRTDGMDAVRTPRTPSSSYNGSYSSGYSGVYRTPGSATSRSGASAASPYHRQQWDPPPVPLALPSLHSLCQYFGQSVAELARFVGGDHLVCAAMAMPDGTSRSAGAGAGAGGAFGGSGGAGGAFGSEWNDAARLQQVRDELTAMADLHQYCELSAGAAGAGTAGGGGDSVQQCVHRWRQFAQGAVATSTRVIEHCQTNGADESARSWTSVYWLASRLDHMLGQAQQGVGVAGEPVARCCEHLFEALVMHALSHLRLGSGSGGVGGGGGGAAGDADEEEGQKVYYAVGVNFDMEGGNEEVEVGEEGEEDETEWEQQTGVVALAPPAAAGGGGHGGEYSGAYGAGFAPGGFASPHDTKRRRTAGMVTPGSVEEQHRRQHPQQDHRHHRRGALEMPPSKRIAMRGDVSAENSDGGAGTDERNSLGERLGMVEVEKEEQEAFMQMLEREAQRGREGDAGLVSGVVGSASGGGRSQEYYVGGSDEEGFDPEELGAAIEANREHSDRMDRLLSSAF